MRRSLIMALAVAGAAAAATVAACNSDTRLASSGGGGAVRVLLTDAPFPFDQVSRVDVHIVSVEGTTNPDSTTAQQWETLTAPDRTFNLLDVQNGATALLGEARVAATRFAAIRLVIRTDLSSITLADGSEAAVTWGASATQPVSALVEEPLPAATGGNLIIDFDVGRSFIPLASGGFQFLPWIRAVDEEGTGTVTGVVRGSDAEVTPVAGASVSLYRSGVAGSLILAATGVSDAQGSYTIHYVSEGGPYVIEAAAPAGVQAAPGYADGVFVTAGQQTSANVTLSEGSNGGHLDIIGSALVGIGQPVSLYARVTSALGDTVAGAAVTWSNSAEAVARLDGSGSSVTLTGLAAGSTRIIAASNDVADTLFVTVVQSSGAVATVDLMPDTSTIAVGDTTALLVVARDDLGNALSGRSVTWSVDPALLHEESHTDAFIVIRGLAAGTAYVKATIDGIADSTRVTVR